MSLFSFNYLCILKGLALRPLNSINIFLMSTVPVFKVCLDTLKKLLFIDDVLFSCFSFTY